jgi:hypothetical protein
MDAFSYSLKKNNTSGIGVGNSHSIWIYYGRNLAAAIKLHLQNGIEANRLQAVIFIQCVHQLELLHQSSSNRR